MVLNVPILVEDLPYSFIGSIELLSDFFVWYIYL